LPEIVPTPIKGEIITEQDQLQRLKYVFEEGALKYRDVIEGIKVHFKAGTNKAGHILGGYLRNGWIVKNGADRHPDTVYKLMINA
jgi:hypothetical protein